MLQWVSKLGLPCILCVLLDIDKILALKTVCPVETNVITRLSQIKQFKDNQNRKNNHELSAVSTYKFKKSTWLCGSSVLPFVRSFALSPLDGASVREAHCEQASTAVREAHCARATVARLVTFESLKWKYYFASNKHLLILRKCYAVHINASSL